MRLKTLIFALFATTAFSGCAATSLNARHDSAVNIARPAQMTESVIRAGIFNLSSWQRITTPNAPASIYIEGDGLAWLNTRTKSLNPTPPDPLALRLAALDTSANVIYIARPCQYSGWSGDGACPDLYWTNGRTAPEVIRAYQEALDSIKAAHAITGFHLIGYSGGAAVAALIAAERSDALSLRTVAGNTDYTVFASIHHVSAMNASLNPVDIARKIAHLPQQHFIGGADKIVPEGIFNSWKRASGETACIHTQTVPENTHEKGWAEKWPALLALPLSCTP